MEPHQRPSPRVSFVVTVDGRGSSLSARARFTADPTSGLARWLRRIAPLRARGVVNVALTSDARVRALNRRYRRLNRTTDVLSFRYADDTSRTQDRVSCLGDIVIARGVAQRQAREAGHDERTEVRILALHGLLHLLGYDHHRDDGKMARAERRLRKKGGLREGLIERSHV